jgi:hypothetical protein
VDLNLTLSLVSLLTGVVLNVVAIALAVYFYTQAKNTEAQVKVGVAEIRQQTDSLGKLTGRLLDRLTRAVTEGRPAHEERQLMVFVEAMRSFGYGPGAQTQPVSAIEQNQEDPRLREQLIAATYLYAAITNVALQSLLPENLADVGDKLRRFIDMSNADVVGAQRLLVPTEEWNDATKALFAEVRDSWLTEVRDTLAYYQVRAAAKEPESDGPSS